MRCPSCGYEVGADQSVCGQCDTRLSGSAPEPIAVSAGGAFVNRYRDAYRVASFLTAFGETAKIVGGVAAALLFLMGFGGVGGAAGFFGGLLLGALFGGLFFLCGVMISAQGQLLRASLDSAVSSSRFMSDTDCLNAMGMPKVEAVRTAQV